MFEELPETIPHKNKTKTEAFAAALGLQVVLVAILIIVQMAMPEKLGEFRLLETLYMAAPPPPPPAPLSTAPSPVRHATPKPVVHREAPVVQERPAVVDEKPAIIAPTAVPKDIARIIDPGTAVPGATSNGVAGGVRGGVIGGVNSGVLGGVLGGAATASVPPPPPTGPVRVGGNVKQPKLVHIEQPQYPPAAKSAHIDGVVVVEAT